MKKAVITILGIQGGKVETNKENNLKTPIIFNIEHQAYYYFENDEDNKQEYFNTLPFLFDVYGKDYDIIPVFTEDAKLFNQKVIEEGYKHLIEKISFDDKFLIKDEKNFEEIFKLFEEILSNNNYEKVIIDVTHGFRHLPLLMLIDLMIHYFRDINTIDKILFAKETIKHTPNDKGSYEFIDLKHYLDLANLNVTLSTFNNNYTIAKIKTSNEKYNNIIDLLESFSQHILANSLKELITSSDSLSKKIIDEIDSLLLEEDSNLKNFQTYLNEIKRHLIEISNLKNEVDFVRYFKLSHNMLNKGYLLNSITLLSEAIGLYVKENILKGIDDNIKSFIEEFERKQPNSLYLLANHSKNIFRLTILDKYYNGDYLGTDFKKQNKKNKITSDIQEYLEEFKHKTEFQEISQLISNIDNLRNNLAHGNSSKRLEDVEQEIKKVLDDFEKLCIKRDISKVKPNKTPATKQDIDKLQNFFKNR